MEYSEFRRRYLGSTRTKNIAGASNRKLNWRGRVHWWILRNLLGQRRTNRRRYELPRTSELPAEYIRLDPWEAQYLYAVAQSAKQGIVEIGRFDGGSTFMLACANPDVPIASIDIAPKDDELLRDLFTNHGVGGNVSLIVEDSQRGDFPDVAQPDLVFVDGDHSEEGCRRDIENWFRRLAPGGHMVFHDSYLGGEGVQAAISGFFRGRDDVIVVQSPYIGAEYWHYPAGSLAHIVKVR